MRYSCDKIIPTLVVVHYKFLLSLINIRSWMRCDLIKAASVWTDLQSVRLSPAQPRLKCWPRAPLTTTGHWPTAWGGNTGNSNNQECATDKEQPRRNRNNNDETLLTRSCLLVKLQERIFPHWRMLLIWYNSAQSNCDNDQIIIIPATTLPSNGGSVMIVFIIVTAVLHLISFKSL